MRAATACTLVALLALLAGCGGGDDDGSAAAGYYKLGGSYTIGGRRYYPAYDPAYDAVGVASWYGSAFHDRLTANGERFDKNVLSAAHTTLPLPSIVEVTNLDNGRRLRLRVNDRGPFVDDRLIDLSEAAARELGFIDRGLANVRVRFLGLAAANGTPPRPTVRVAAPRVETVASQGFGCDGVYVQTGVFTRLAAAEAWAATLRDLTAVRLDRVVLPDGRDAARIRLGPHLGRQEALSTLAQLRGRGYQDAYLVGCS